MNCQSSVALFELRAPTDQADLVRAILRLDGWLDTMRGPDGYGGPVAHWWQNCLQFTGAALDWRYEGIIIGYLNLYRHTRSLQWLYKACQAGNDLVNGQMPTGNFRNSCFEANPYPGGTPHEAACDLGLLHLASTLKQHDEPDWPIYATAAERNMRDYYLDQLWDSESQQFWDHPTIPSFVPNKSATLAEALFALTQITEDDEFAEVYAIPTLNHILSHQLRQDDALDGAIYQYSQNNRFVAWFFPYYIARCASGLVAGYEWTGDSQYLEGARRAMQFVLRWRYEDGSFPQVVYSKNRTNRFPQWIAAVGDILRVMVLMIPYGLEADLEPTLTWLLRGQDATGGLRTAHGFAAQASQGSPGPLPEFRDLLPVCGWADKTWRFMTGLLSPDSPIPLFDPERQPWETDCVFRGDRMLYREDDASIKLFHHKRLIYDWAKVTPWPQTCELRMHLK